MDNRAGGCNRFGRAVRPCRPRFLTMLMGAAGGGPADALSGRRDGGEGDIESMRLPAGLRHGGRPRVFIRTRPCVAALTLALVQATLCPPPAQAQTTGPPPTVWSFLGVPNPFGMNAADQQSANPAIQAAAKAKAAKHEICKKKAAIKYLAGLGCTPEHPEVMPALMAAMDDPDELVRYEAVKAVLQTAEVCQSPEQKKETRKTKGMSESCADWKKAMEKHVCDTVDRLCGKAPPKEHKHKLKKAMQGMLGEECADPAQEDCPCADRRGSCCSPEMREKLMKLAYGRDDMGCFLEPSKRVRDLAVQALNACNSCACGCEGAMGTESGMDHVVREMPPVDDRETRPSDKAPLPMGGPCSDDMLIVPSPTDHPEVVPTPAPLPEPEMIPAPAAATIPPETRSVLVRAPQPAAPRPSAPGRGETLWQPLDPGAAFTAADAVGVPEFLADIERRPPSPPLAGRSAPRPADRRHADTRLALVPTTAAKGMPQPLVGPAVRSPLPPRQPPLRQPPPASPAARVDGLWTPLAPRAFLAGAANPPVTYGWATMPPEEPLAVVRRLTGFTPQPRPMATSAPAQPARPAVPSPAVSHVVPPATPSPTAGLTVSDRTRWLTLACLVAALAYTVFGWPSAKPAAPGQSAAGSGGMMRNRGR